MLNYKQIKSRIENKGMTVKEFCKEIDYSYPGFQKSIDEGKFPAKKILELCFSLGISPHEFFEWDDSSANKGVYASNISGINTQNSNEAIQALREELKEQRGIIKEKDKQINRLLAIIERGKKP